MSRIIRVRVSLLTAACLATALAGHGAGAAEEKQFPAGPDFTIPEGQPAVPGEVIVRFKEPMPVAMLSDEVPEAERPIAISDDTFVFKIGGLEEGADASALFMRSESLVEALSERDDVLYAEPNYYAYPLETTPNDAHFDRMWHYHARGAGPGEGGGVGLPAAWDDTTGSASIVVAVIDTGILPNHPEFDGSVNLLDGYDMISEPRVENDPQPGRDDDETDPGDAVAAGECFPGSRARGDSWHGSHVAGTVGAGKTDDGAGIAGVAWQVGVLPVRVLGKCGGTSSDIAAAIRWSAGLPVPGVRANTNPAQVINMSLGGRGACSNTYRTAIADAVAAGATVVVAAGNSNDDAAGYQPASCPDAVTVGAVDSRGHIARYSNFGPAVDVMAPGGDTRPNPEGGVLSAVQGGYAWYNGTSMAAPHVAGIVALWLAQDDSLTPAQIAQRVTTNAVALGAADGCGGDRCGSGLIIAKVDGGNGSPAPPPDPPRCPECPKCESCRCGLLGAELLLVPVVARWTLRRRRRARAVMN